MFAVATEATPAEFVVEVVFSVDRKSVLTVMVTGTVLGVALGGKQPSYPS